MQRIRFVLPAGLCVLLGLAGCSRDSGDRWSANRPQVAPAEGVVKYNGQPLAEATVVLAPAGQGHAASGVTDSQGRFSLAAFHPKPGAVPGNYRVTIVKQEPDAAAGSPGIDEYGNALPPPMRSVIPVKYCDPSQSELVVEVPSVGTTDLEFDLRD